MTTVRSFIVFSAIFFLCHDLAAQTERGRASFVFQNDPEDLVYNADGTPLFGSQFVAMLYGGGNPDLLYPARTSLLGPSMRPVAFDFLPGQFFGASVSVDTIGGVCGLDSWLQVRAWDTRVALTYEAAVELDIGGYGESIPFVAEGGNNCVVPPEAPHRMPGLESFSLRPIIPEPSPALLLLLGAPLVLWRAWRKMRKPGSR